MFDKEIALDSLLKIRSVIDTITDRTSMVEDLNDFLCTPGGMLWLDALCMNLIALGEAVKGLDKLTHGELLPKYPEIYWSGVMRMRDKILITILRLIPKWCSVPFRKMSRRWWKQLIE